MGLSVSVGILSDLENNDFDGYKYYLNTFQNINSVLKEKGLKKHNEPENLNLNELRIQNDHFPYSYIHYLRRFYARLYDDPDWFPKPVQDREDPASDEILDEVYTMMDSHLLTHSDNQGFYLPIVFTDIIFPENNYKIPGDMIGSSFSLLDELKFIAPKLNIELSDALNILNSEDLNNEIKSEKEFWREKLTWITLFEASKLSIKYNSAIVFH